MGWPARLWALVAVVPGRLPWASAQPVDGPWALKHVHPETALPRASIAVVPRPRRNPSTGLACGLFKLSRWDETRCPQECPYKSISAEKECRGECISGIQCRDASKLGGFPNHTSMECEGCRVPGCKRCDSSRDNCAQCSSGLRLQDDATCDLIGRPVFHLVLVVIGCMVVFLIAYLVMLKFRKVVNKDVLDEALEERELSKLRDESVPGMPLYRISTPLTHEPISGRGVLLFFRHMLAMLLWSVLVTVSLAFLASFYELQKEMDSEADVCDEAANSPDIRGDLQERHEADQALSFFVLIVYIMSTIGSLVLVVCQRTAFRALDSGTTGMQDFALVAKGFPQEAGHWGNYPPEREYREFFEGVLGFRIVGVSLCWHFNEEREAVSQAMARELAILEWGEGYADKLKSERRPTLASFDNLLCGLSGSQSDSDDDSDSEGIGGSSSTNTGASLATRFNTSGYAIVVFHRKEDVTRALHAFSGATSSHASEEEDEHEPLGPWWQLSSPTYAPSKGRIRYRGKYEIHLAELPCGPGEVCWENYGKHWVKVSRDIAMGIFKVALFIVLWCLIFYGPYAYFVMFTSSVAGNASALASGIQGTFLGLVISLGNQLVYQVIGKMSESAGFHYSTMADNFNMSMYCIAVLINTALDLWTVVLLANGERLDASFHEHASSMKISSMAKMPSEEQAFSSQLFAYLFPGTILCPFLLEPMIYFLKKEVSILIVRSRSGVGPKHAQEILGLDRFEFSRYADNVTNITLVIIFLFCTSSRVFPAFLSLVVSIAYIFAWDTYRVLRGTVEHEMDLDKTETTAQFLLVMPCSFLAACTIIRCYKQNWLGLDDFSAGPYALVAFLVHGVLHAGLIWLVQHTVSNSSEEETDHDETFAELGQEQALTWFNANPVHCLRSRYVLGDNPPCIYCEKGREKLLRVNEAAGCFFDGMALDRTIDKAVILKKREFSFFAGERPRRGKAQKTGSKEGSRR